MVQEVLRALDLKPTTLALPERENLLSEIQDFERRSKSEGDEHKRLKLFLAQNPKKAGIRWMGIGDTEQALLSGDRLDVSFRDGDRWIAVEVKPRQSPLADLIRGIFQCIKYRAALAAELRYEGLQGRECVSRIVPRVILACGALPPKEVLALAEFLDVEIKPNIAVPEGFVP
jgi:hypothetical protein